MPIRKLNPSKKEQKKPQLSVSNSTSFWGNKAQGEQKKTLLDNQFQFDPYLIAAILKRNLDGIKTCVHSSESNGNRATFSEDQHKIFKGIFTEKVYYDPVKLAMKLCDSETPETTKNNDPTRFDVLHYLAVNWDKLVESASLKRLPIPDLKDVLNYARNLKTHIPLHTFILGLTEERKEEAATILNAKVVSSSHANSL